MHHHRLTCWVKTLEKKQGFKLPRASYLDPGVPSGPKSISNKIGNVSPIQQVRRGSFERLQENTRKHHLFFLGGAKKNLTLFIFHLQIYPSICCCFFLIRPYTHTFHIPLNSPHPFFHSSGTFSFGGGQPPPKQQISPQCADVAHVMPILSNVRRSTRVETLLLRAFENHC